MPPKGRRSKMMKDESKGDEGKSLYERVTGKPNPKWNDPQFPSIADNIASGKMKEDIKGGVSKVKNVVTKGATWLREKALSKLK
jgi:hypothetical protein